MGLRRSKGSSLPSFHHALPPYPQLAVRHRPENRVRVILAKYGIGMRRAHHPLPWAFHIKCGTAERQYSYPRRQQCHSRMVMAGHMYVLAYVRCEGMTQRVGSGPLATALAPPQRRVGAVRSKYDERGKPRIELGVPLSAASQARARDSIFTLLGMMLNANASYKARSATQRTNPTKPPKYE